MSTYLLDGNALVALTDAPDVLHARCVAWFSSTQEPFATCSITQGTLLRMLLRYGAVATPIRAAEVLGAFFGHPRHRFWPDELEYRSFEWCGVSGHRQIIDAHLAALARSRQGRLLSLDKGLAALHSDVAELLEP